MLKTKEDFKKLLDDKTLTDSQLEIFYNFYRWGINDLSFQISEQMRKIINKEE